MKKKHRSVLAYLTAGILAFSGFSAHAENKAEKNEPKKSIEKNAELSLKDIFKTFVKDPEGFSEFFYIDNGSNGKKVAIGYGFRLEEDDDILLLSIVRDGEKLNKTGKIKLLEEMNGCLSTMSQEEFKQKYASCIVAPDSLTKLFNKKYESALEAVKKNFPDFNSFPIDIQVVVLDLSYGLPPDKLNEFRKLKKLLSESKQKGVYDRKKIASQVLYKNDYRRNSFRTHLLLNDMLQKNVPNYKNLNLEAQMLISLIAARNPDTFNKQNFPKFFKAISEGDYFKMAKESGSRKMKKAENDSVKKRFKKIGENCADVFKYYPNALKLLKQKQDMKCVYQQKRSERDR